MTIGMEASVGNGPAASMMQRRYGQIGTGTPAVAASGAVQAPVARRTRSARMSPSLVRAPVTRAPSRLSDSTRTPSMKRTPSSAAAAANPASASSGAP